MINDYQKILSAQAKLCERIPEDLKEISCFDEAGGKVSHYRKLKRHPRRKWRHQIVKRKTEESVIQVSTVFTSAASPIDVSKDLVVPPGVTLTIEKGVHMQFAPNTGLKIRGSKP